MLGFAFLALLNRRDPVKFMAVLLILLSQAISLWLIHKALVDGIWFYHSAIILEAVIIYYVLSQSQREWAALLGVAKALFVILTFVGIINYLYLHSGVFVSVYMWSIYIETAIEMVILGSAGLGLFNGYYTDRRLYKYINKLLSNRVNTKIRLPEVV
ncbi:MAG: hypothetical protein COB69_00220 [Phycisphaera sp.]|nr:MAG: hypothetical protein COB69_00220 [Phycisphaera sp.]